MTNLQKIWKSTKRIILFMLLLAAVLYMIIPFLWMISTSLKAKEFVLSMPPQLIPNPMTGESYIRLFEIFPIGRMFLNTVIVAVLSTVGQIITSAMAAYVFARLEFKGKNFLFLLYLSTLMIPQQVTITPLFILMSKFGWLNSYKALILPGVFTAFGTFLLRQYFLTIPKELEEAAVIDGASHFTIFLRIILPLTKPGLATLGVFAFMSSWNSYLWPLFVVRKHEMMTLPVGLSELHGRWLTEWNLVMAGALITIVPILIIFLFAQKYFVQGVVMSGIKG